MINVYYNGKAMATQTSLELMGLVTEDAIKKAGYLPVEYDYPYYNRKYYGIAPKKLILQNGRYIQKFNTVELDLEICKKSKLEEINTTYTEKANLAKVGTPEDEVLTWDIQKLEAEAYQISASNPTPSIDILAINRGMDRVELINKILVKVETYKQYIFALTGKRQKYEEEIAKATSFEELMEIKWEDLPDTK